MERLQRMNRWSLQEDDDGDEEEEIARAQFKAQQEAQRNLRREQEQQEAFARARAAADTQVTDAGDMERAVQRARCAVTRQAVDSELQIGFRIDTSDMADEPSAATVKLPSLPGVGKPKAAAAPGRGNQRGNPRGRSNPSGRRKESPQRWVNDEFEAMDTFVPLAVRQPCMHDAMALAPGVGLKEGAKTSVAEMSNERMSKRDYDQMTSGNLSPSLFRGAVSSGNRRSTSSPRGGRPADGNNLPSDERPQERLPRQSSEVSIPPPQRQAESLMDLEAPVDGNATRVLSRSSSTPVASSRSHPGLARELDHHTMRVVRDKSALQPTAPTLDVRWQQRFKTLGFQSSVRERVPISGTQAFSRRSLRHIRPQPPIGATMGHGLLPYTSADDSW